jgi:hypothetical protein
LVLVEVQGRKEQIQALLEELPLHLLVVVLVLRLVLVLVAMVALVEVTQPTEHQTIHLLVLALLVKGIMAVLVTLPLAVEVVGLARLVVMRGLLLLKQLQGKVVMGVRD